RHSDRSPAESPRTRPSHRGVAGNGYSGPAAVPAGRRHPHRWLAHRHPQTAPPAVLERTVAPAAPAAHGCYPEGVAGRQLPSGGHDLLKRLDCVSDHRDFPRQRAIVHNRFAAASAAPAPSITRNGAAGRAVTRATATPTTAAL